MILLYREGSGQTPVTLHDINSVKCVFLNVGGLGIHATKIREIIWIYSDKQVILLAETWLRDIDMASLKIDNYKIFYQNRGNMRRGSRRASGGLLALVRQDVVGGVNRLDIGNTDVMWIRFSHHYFDMDKDLCLGLLYFSPEHSTRHAHSDPDMHRTLEVQILQITEMGHNCLLVGDFNARTSNMLDFIAHDDNDGYIPLPETYVADTVDIPPRASEDQVTNEFGHLLLDICKSTTLRIVNGRYYNDAGIGSFTCHTPNGHSLVDYLLGNPDAINTYLSFFSIGDMTTLSATHCPILFNMSFSGRHTNSESTYGYRFRWDPDLRETYLENLNMAHSRNLLQQIGHMLDEEQTAVDINAVVRVLNEVIIDAASPFRRRYTMGGNQQRPISRPAWWSDECYRRKLDHNCAWRRYKHDKTDENYQIYQVARRAYTNTRRYHQTRHRSQQVHNLCTIQSTNPTQQAHDMISTLKLCGYRVATSYNMISTSLQRRFTYVGSTWK